MNLFNDAFERVLAAYLQQYPGMQRWQRGRVLEALLVDTAMAAPDRVKITGRAANGELLFEIKPPVKPA